MHNEINVNLQTVAQCMQDGEDTFFAREALQGRLPKYVELLKFKVGACRPAPCPVCTLLAQCIQCTHPSSVFVLTPAILVVSILAHQTGARHVCAAPCAH